MSALICFSNQLKRYNIICGTCMQLHFGRGIHLVEQTDNLFAFQLIGIFLPSFPNFRKSTIMQIAAQKSSLHLIKCFGQFPVVISYR